MSPQPKEEMNLLLKRTIDFAEITMNSNDAPNEFAWQRLMDDAQKAIRLGSLNAAHGYGIQSVLYGLKADAKNWKICADKVFECEADTGAILNAVQFGLSVGETKYKINEVQQIAETTTDPELITVLIGYFNARCQFSLATDLYTKLQSMGKEKLVLDPSRNIRHYSKDFDGFRIDEKAVLDRLDVAAKAVFEFTHKPLFKNSSCYVDESFLYYFILNVTDDEVFKIEWEIIDRLNDEFDDTMSDCVSFAVATPDMLIRENTHAN